MAATAEASERSQRRPWPFSRFVQSLDRDSVGRRAALPDQAVLNIDETGHPDSGQRLGTWGFHVPQPREFTLFHIDPSRSSEVLKEFLGETFRGVVGCEYLSAYRKLLHDVGGASRNWRRLVSCRRWMNRKAGNSKSLGFRCITRWNTIGNPCR